MACSNNRNNVVLLFLGLLSFVCHCTHLTKRKRQENISSLSEVRHWRHGKLLIGQKLEQSMPSSGQVKELDLDYQSDMGWEVPDLQPEEYGFPNADNNALERLLKMEPTVDCSGSHMRLKVQDAEYKPGSLLFVDRGNLSPLSLSKLPKSCGYKVGSTNRDLVVTAPYDGCFVIVEEACYVLHLRWLGLPVQMSCPSSQHVSHSSSDPPMVTCHAEGMVVKTDRALELSEIKVNLNGYWEPLKKVLPMCGFSAVKHLEGITINLPHTPCMEKKDGVYSLQLFMGNENYNEAEEVKVFCPALASPDPSKSMIDIGQSTHRPAPTQNVVTSRVQDNPSNTPKRDPAKLWNNYFNNFIQTRDSQLTASQPTASQSSGHVTPQPHPGHMSHGRYPYPIPPGLPQAAQPPPQPGSPSRGTAQPNQPLYFPERHVDIPFYFPHEPMKPTTAPETTTSKEPPFYPYHVYYPTVQSETAATNTASPKQTVPQQYQVYGPYYYPFPSENPPQTTKAPTPFTHKPADFSTPCPGAVVCPQNSKSESILSAECVQYCYLGLPNCCPQIAFHHHMYHFVPHDQNGNSNPKLFPLPGLPNGFFYAPSQGQEGLAHPSVSEFTNLHVSQWLNPLRGPNERLIYNRPLEGNSAVSENKPREQTEQRAVQPPSHFEPNVYPYSVDVNPQSGRHSISPSSYSEYVDQQLRGMQFNAESSHQSDGPPAQNQFVSQTDKNNNVKGTGLVFHSEPDHQHPVPEQKNLPSHQSADLPRRTAKREETGSVSSALRNYVLLKQGPPGREGNLAQSRSFNPVLLESQTMGRSLESNFQNDFINEEKYENLKLLGEKISTDSNLASLRQAPAVGEATFDARFSQLPHSTSGHRTSQQDPPLITSHPTDFKGNV